MEASMDISPAHHYLAHFALFLLISYLVCALIFILPLWHTARKAGLNSAVALWALFPGLGTLIAMYYIAFATWKRAPDSAV
jgi:hypothetical protein